MGTSRSQTRIQRAYSGVPKVPALVQPQNDGLIVYSVQVQNAAASGDVGILKGLNNSVYDVLKDTGTGASNISSLLRAEQSVAIFENDGDSLFVGAKDPFGFFGINLSTAGAGGATVNLFYWNGSAWVALPSYEAFADDTASYLFGIFPAPVEWERGGTDLNGDSLSSEQYFVKIVATATWASTTPIANNLIAAEVLTFKNNLATDASLELSVIETNKPLDLESGQYIFCYFENVNDQNTIEISYSFSG